jgi:NAD(P)H-hydrate repair Nnr-like enzyme with NAD(P)H-hydrate dehydratase domain
MPRWSQHVLIIGPGLGRDDHMQNCARIAFELAKKNDQMGVVVDADGLWLVQVRPSFGPPRWHQNDPMVVLDWPGVPRVILTPNIMEFKRLCQALVGVTADLWLTGRKSTPIPMSTHCVLNSPERFKMSQLCKRDLQI